MAAAWHDAGASGTVVGSATLTQSYTPTSGADYLVVRISVDTGKTINSVTFNGTSMYQIGIKADDVGFSKVAIYGLRNPYIGTANVVVTMSASCDTIYAWIRSADGVDTSSDGAAHGTVASINETYGTSPSMDVASASGDLVIDVVTNLYNSMTVGSGQTLEADERPGGGSVYVFASWEAATGATTTMSWTNAGEAYYAAIGVAIKAGSGATSIVPQAMANYRMRAA
jgi:hypothetical protein